MLAEPIYANEQLVNAAHAQDRVVVVFRGKLPLYHKIFHAQMAGALAVLVVDMEDTCRDAFDYHCVSGSNQAFGEGWGSQDNPELWSKTIRVPYALMRKGDARILLRQLNYSDDMS